VLDVAHGPGHQSGHHKGRAFRDDDYHHAFAVLTREQKREWYEDLTRELESPVGQLRLVKKLPERIRKTKLSEYGALGKNARHVIRELQGQRKSP
jgi:hypothetical protein